MSGPAVRPFTMLQGDGPVCEGDACLPLVVGAPAGEPLSEGRRE